MFTAGEQGDRLELFARGAGDDVDAAFEDIFFVDEFEVGFTAAEDFREHIAEVFADALECFDEHGAGLGIDAGDDLVEFVFGGDEVVVLLGEELEALFSFFVFLDGDHIDGAHIAEAFFEFCDLGGDGFPIRGGAVLGHFLGRERFDFGGALVGERDRDALAFDFVEVELIFFVDAGAEVIDAHLFLSGFDFECAASFLAPAELLAV